MTQGLKWRICGQVERLSMVGIKKKNVFRMKTEYLLSFGKFHELPRQI